MKNIYFYLAGIALLVSGTEMVSNRSGNTPTSHEWVAKPQISSEKKSQEKVPFSRSRKNSRSKALLAPSISATNTYAVTSGGATAGGELEYTVVITNGGPDPATGTTFTETIDINTTLVPGSVTASPVAVNDSYSTIGNVGIDIADGQGLFANDVSPMNTPLSLSGSTTITSANGGTATVTAANGAFKYEPAAGFIGTDTFTYTIQNGSGMTSSATVSITVTGAIWFIKSDAPGGGTGTLAKPFNSLNAFQGINNGAGNNAKDGHFIFIYSGNYDGGIIVRNNQKVFGQGASPSLLTLTGLSAPSGSNLLPATGGTRPTLTNSAGNVFSLSGVATVQGLNIGNSTGAKFLSSASGLFTASEINLTGNGVALNISDRALAATFGQVSSTVSSGSTSPIQLSNVTGNLTISSGTLTANNSTNIPALNIAGGITLAVNLTAVNANGGNKGMIISGTTGTFQVSGSGTTLGSGGTIQNIGRRGIELLNTTGITLKNMNLVSANNNTADGPTTPSGTATDMNNLNANAAVYALNTNGLTMDRVIISGTVAQEGINLRGTSNFNFTNGSIGSSGSPGISTEGCIFAVNTGGTNTITNSTFTDPGGRAVYFANFSTNMTLLTVDNSTFQDADGASGLQVVGYGTSTMKVRIQNNSRFLNCRTAGAEVYANDNSVITASMVNLTVDPGAGVGRGLDVAAANNATMYFNIEGNNVKHQKGIGINSFASGNGRIEGYIINNTTENLAGSSAVSGIVSSVEGVTPGANQPEAVVVIQGNTVKNVLSVHGISTSAISTGGAESSFTIKNNNVQVSGPIAWYGIDVLAPGLGVAPLNTATICSNVSGNAVTLSAPGNFAYRARTGDTGTTIRSQGTGSSIVEVWNNGGNTPLDRAFPAGVGTFTFGATCPTPGAITFREGAVEELAEKESIERDAIETVATPSEETKSVVTSATPVTEPVTNEVTEPVSPSPAKTEAPLAGETVTVNGAGSGFTLANGKSTTIKFKVTINNNIPASVCQLSTQGTVSGSNFTSVLTDDPNIAGSNNPTVTAVTSVPVITFCPGNQTVSPDAGTCTSTQTLSATADACPAATITYSVNGNPITFPYIFPAGATTVLVTASNGIGTAPTCSFTITVTPTPAPPITGQPDAQTICAGAGTSFTVASSQAGVTYQWQKKPAAGAFENISVGSNPTADDATLTLSNVPASDNLSEYRCIVSNPCNTTTSAAAVLTVNQITGSTLAGTTTVNQGAPAPVVTFGATGGTLPYTFTYKINGGSNLTVTTTGVNTTATVSRSTATVGVFTYELVTVTDAQNCTLTPSPAQTASLTIANNLTATISGAASACQNAAQPVITFTAVNGIAPFTFTYKINGGADLTVSTTGANTTATVNAPTTATGTFTYSLTNVSGAGSASTTVSGQTATVTVNQVPTIALTGDQYACAGDRNTYTVFFTASPGAVVTSDKGVVNGNTVTGIPSKETAILTATLGSCATDLPVFKDCSLPVTLIDFKGSNIENTAVLKWSTAEETNSDRFDIQRSTDGKNWQIVGTEKSHGESYSAVSYSFVDKQPVGGDNFYRLKMVDLDNTFAYSRVINVRFPNDVLKSEFYPNPVSDVLTLSSTNWNLVKSVEIHNMNGTLVYRSGKTVTKTVSVKDLPAGIYILTITHSSGEIVNRKVLINR